MRRLTLTLSERSESKGRYDEAVKARLLAACVVTVSLVAACDEDPPESAYDTETPFETPTPGVTPVAITIPAGGAAVSASGRIGAPGEADQFTFSLAPTDRIRIDVDAQGLTPFSSELLDAVVTLYAPNGAVVAVSDDGTNAWSPSALTPTPLRDPYLLVDAAGPGVHTLVIEDAGGGGDDNEEYDYRVTLSQVVSTVLEGGLACADAVALPAITGIVSVTGTVNPISSTDSCCGAAVLPCVGAPVPARDVSYLASLTSGTRVQITRTGSAFDGAVYVTRPSTVCTGGGSNTIENACMAGADGANATDGFVFTPMETGAYFIWVDGVSNSGGSFTLDVQQLP